MFDIAPTELLLCAIVALLVIGPKDLPKAMRVVGHWVGRARAVARQFRAGFDTMVREAELEEMEKKWREENERIMREHPSPESPPAEPDGAGGPNAALPAPQTDERQADEREIGEQQTDERQADDQQLDLGLGGNDEGVRR
jgi:sec-independent protein translocase protein TatB